MSKFTCPCGNTDTEQTAFYNGILGYQAIVCVPCARVHDNNGTHEPDDWSKSFVKYKEPAKPSIIEAAPITLTNAMLFNMENRIFRALTTKPEADVLECRKEAEQIIKKWVEENKVKVVSEL